MDKFDIEKFRPGNDKLSGKNKKGTVAGYAMVGMILGGAAGYAVMRIISLSTGEEAGNGIMLGIMAVGVVLGIIIWYLRKH